MTVLLCRASGCRERHLDLGTLGGAARAGEAEADVLAQHAAQGLAPLLGPNRHDGPGRAHDLALDLDLGVLLLGVGRAVDREVVGAAALADLLLQSDQPLSARRRRQPAGAAAGL